MVPALCQRAPLLTDTRRVVIAKGGLLLQLRSPPWKPWLESLLSVGGELLEAPLQLVGWVGVRLVDLGLDVGVSVLWPGLVGWDLEEQGG